MPNTFNVYQALANQAMTKSEIMKRCNLTVRQADRVLEKLRQQNLVKPVANASLGFVYGVVL